MHMFLYTNTFTLSLSFYKGFNNGTRFRIQAPTEKASCQKAKTVLCPFVILEVREIFDKTIYFLKLKKKNYKDQFIHIFFIFPHFVLIESINLLS